MTYELTEEEFKKVLVALLYADSYVKYVETSDEAIHKEAVGMPSAKEALKEGLAVLCPSYNQRKESV